MIARRSSTKKGADPPTTSERARPERTRTANAPSAAVTHPCAKTRAAWTPTAECASLFETPKATNTSGTTMKSAASAAANPSSAISSATPAAMRSRRSERLVAGDPSPIAEAWARARERFFHVEFKNRAVFRRRLDNLVPIAFGDVKVSTRRRMGEGGPHGGNQVPDRGIPDAMDDEDFQIAVDGYDGMQRRSPRAVTTMLPTPHSHDTCGTTW